MWRGRKNQAGRKLATENKKTLLVGMQKTHRGGKGEGTVRKEQQGVK